MFRSNFNSLTFSTNTYIAIEIIRISIYMNYQCSSKNVTYPDLFFLPFPRSDSSKNVENNEIRDFIVILFFSFCYCKNIRESLQNSDLHC